MQKTHDLPHVGDKRQDGQRYSEAHAELLFNSREGDRFSSYVSLPEVRPTLVGRANKWVRLEQRMKPAVVARVCRGRGDGVMCRR